MKTITRSEWIWKHAKKSEAEQREFSNFINGRFPGNRMDPLIKKVHSLELQWAHLEWIKQCGEI